MLTLRDLQNAMRAALVDGDDTAAAAMLADGVSADRLDIYRNTFVAGATRALRLSFPAVHRLVGNDFFDSAAAFFVAQNPPRAACLDDYGAAFPQFMTAFPPAAPLQYLADVARLEWAVSRALHATDTPPLDLEQLQALTHENQARVCFAPHPSVTLLRLDHPADAIWRAVLEGNDAALAIVDPEADPVRLMVERAADGVAVSRLDRAAFDVTAALCAGRTLADVVADFSGAAGGNGQELQSLLAGHLGAGRFADFQLAPPDATAPASFRSA